MASSTTNEVVFDLSPLIRVYKDGTVERLLDRPHAPPSPDHPDPVNGVLSKDISISPEVSARLYLPRLEFPEQKLPVLVYYHGGGFCFESAFSETHHGYVNRLVAESGALVVSVEYRLAPEHPLPAGYDDSWAALQWVASHAEGGGETTNSYRKDPWLADHGDFGKFFVAGDSSGANIAHNMVMRASTETLKGNLKISGLSLAFPHFWGSNPIGSMSVEENEQCIPYRVWGLVYPSAPGGIDNPMINPVAENGLSLTRLNCSKIIVCTAEKDLLRERAHQYVEAVKKIGWRGEIELVDFDAAEHCFQIDFPDEDPEKTKEFIKIMANFIQK